MLTPAASLPLWWEVGKQRWSRESLLALYQGRPLSGNPSWLMLPLTSNALRSATTSFAAVFGETPSYAPLDTMDAPEGLKGELEEEDIGDITSLYEGGGSLTLGVGVFSVDAKGSEFLAGSGGDSVSLDDLRPWLVML